MKESNKIVQIVLLIAGTLILAIAINLFFLNNNLSTGGASGIALIVYYLYKVPVGLVVILINTPLFIIALRDLGLKFCSKAIIGTVLLSFFIELTSGIVSLIKIEQDLFLACIFRRTFKWYRFIISFQSRWKYRGVRFISANNI